MVYVISSVTTRKSFAFEHTKTYEYTHIDAQLYWRYIKDTDFLIAQPEKALLDMFYFCLKGLRKLPTEELDLSRINIRTFRLYAEKIAVPQFQTFIRKHKMV